MQRVRIADLIVDIDNRDTAFFNQRLQAYRVSDAGQADVSIVFRAPEKLIPPQGVTQSYNERLRVT